MSWVNLDDVYVNKTGDSIAGNLSVGGTLTINNAKGNGGTYNVANEITTLRDSVSQVSQSLSKTRVWYKSVVVSGSGYINVMSTADIAPIFGISTSEVDSKIVPIAYNGDLNANNCTVNAYISNGYLSIRAATSGTYRANIYLIMP
mgnify:CR=1 FL=1